MWYTLPYANTIMYTPAHGGRAGNLGGRSPVLVRLYCTPLPDPPRQCRGTINHHDCAPTPLYRSNGPQHHSCVPPAGSRRAAASLIATAHPVDSLRCRDLRVPPSAPPSESADVRQADQPVDPLTGRRGQFRPGPYPTARQRRDHSACPAPFAGVVETRQPLDHQSRSGLSPQKKKTRSTDCAGHDAAHVGAGLWR